MSQQNHELLDFCKRMPKVELHAHLNGSISPATMQKLLDRHREKLCPSREASSTPQLWQTSNAMGDRSTVEERFVVFKTIHTIVDDEEAVSMVAHDVVREYAADGVVYLELRSTPRANPNTGMTKRSYVTAVLSGIENSLQVSMHTDKMHVRLLLSIDRRQSVAEALDTVQLAQEYSSKQDSRVVGIDLSGNPSAGDMAELLPVLKSAKEKGLKLTFHMAEIPHREEETWLLLSAGPDRIGHGTFLHREAQNEQAVRQIMQQRIPIEICMTSNVKAHTVSSFHDHQLGYWQSREHPVIICTDDKGVFATSLSEEYCIAATTFSLTREEVWKLSREAVGAIFEDETFKTKLKKHWDIE